MTRSLPLGTLAGSVAPTRRVVPAAARTGFGRAIATGREGVLRHLVVMPMFVLVAGCASGNSHVGSHFDCRAPGGTCAPMSVIDARAVAGLGHAQPVNTGTPAHPQSGGHTVPAARSTPSTPPLRTNERVLRIVFPAHIDADGVYRDESTAHAVVENGEWVDALTGPPALRTPSPAQGAAAILPAPEKSALATLDEVIAARAARPGPSSASALSPAPAAPLIVHGTPSRSPSPQSLAEVTASLSAPIVATLDSAESSTNYDRPDVPAVAMADPAAGAAIQPAPAAMPQADVAARPDAVAPARTARGKGKLYPLPAVVPQPDQATAVPAPAPATTSALNGAELARVGRPAGVSVPPNSTRGGRADQVDPMAPVKP